MNNLIETHDDGTVVGSYMIAKALGRKHDSVLKLIATYNDDLLDMTEVKPKSGRIRLPFRKVQVAGSKKPVTEYLLNEEQVFFLIMCFRNTDQVLDFKEQMTRAFFEMRDTLRGLTSQQQSPEWIKARAHGKLIRRNETDTDTIKDFIEYAKHQGSKNADKYYMILSKCVNDKLFDGKVKRNTMGIAELMIIGCADGVVSKALIEGMVKSLPYKAVYKLARDRLITLAEIRGVTTIDAEKVIGKLEE